MLNHPIGRVFAGQGALAAGRGRMAMRSPESYLAESTRVLSAKYSGVLQAAWLRAVGGAPAE